MNTKLTLRGLDDFTDKVSRFMDTRCEAAAISLYGTNCSNQATVWDEETERNLCADCARKKLRGEL